MAFANASNYVAAMGVGINSDAVKTKPSRRAVQSKPQYYQKFRDRGFNHIRLRIVNDITFDQYDSSGVLVGGNQLLDEIDAAITNSLAVGLLPIVAFGGGALEEDPTPENEERFFQWWVKCSDRLTKFDDRVSIDLIIEIGNPLQQFPEVINRVYARVIEHVRLTQLNRVIFCAPRMLSEPRKLKDLVIPLNDPFIAVEVHDYASGMTKDITNAKYWDESNPDPAVREANRQRLRDTLDVAIAWREQTGVPLWFGAILSAPYNKDGGTYSPQEQAVFAQFVMDECKARNMPVAWNSDDKFIDMTSMTWKADQNVVLNAITGVIL